MSQSNKEELINQLSPGDVLIIVPPGAPTETPSLAPHLLQACCQSMGISVGVFYANLHFARLIDIILYHAISNNEQMTFIGERLFYASAFGPPPMGRNIHHLIDPNWLPDHLWHKKNKIASRKMSDYLAPIRKWILSVDWRHVESQAAQWTVSTAKQISRKGYRVVGCSNSLGRLLPAIALLNHLKQINPYIVTVLGGALCEGEMAEGILSLETGIDYIFSGESDKTFPAFVHDILAGQRPKERIIYGKEVLNLDEIPPPNFREYFQQAGDDSPSSLSSGYLFSGNEFPIPYETSRGCRWKKCTFCGLNGEKKTYRTKSPGKVMGDLAYLANNHPTSPVQIVDNIMPLQYFKTLLPRISKTFPSIRFQYEVYTDLTLDQVIALKQAGAYLIQPGIESLSPSLLKRLRKRGTFRQNISFLRYIRSVGINLWWNLLFGIPGDQICEYEEMLEIIPLIRHLRPPNKIYPTRIPRFSLYQKAPEEFEISNLRPAGLYKDILPPHANLEKIANFFTGDFKAQSYEHPDIIDRLRKEYLNWSKAWRPEKTNTTKFEPPKLHLELKPFGQFVLHDTRGLPKRPEKMVVDREQASVLLVARSWENSPELQWAVDAKLAVLKESWFIPLATAEPEVLLQFERDYCRKSNNKV